MQMLNRKRATREIKKSHLLIIGSLLVFFGILVISWNYLMKIKCEVFSDMNIAMADVESTDDNSGIDVIGNVPVANNLSVDSSSGSDFPQQQTVDYDKYLGVLEIPRIGLKRGFYNTDSKYNNIQYNVTIVKGSTLPDVVNGNLILMAHSGDAYISYFAYLYRLQIGDFAYVTYNGNKYKYQIVNIYEVPKNGSVKIIRNYDHTSLTLVTCTKNNDTTQTVYIAELV